MSLRIRELRKERGLTQAQLAKLSGVSRSYLAEMESGSKTINSRRIAQVARALAVAERDLYPIDGAMEKFLRLPEDDRGQVEDLINHLYSKISTHR